MPPRVVALAVALGATITAGGIAATPALAGPGFYITLYNKTSNAQVTLIRARGEDCWYTNDLDHPLDQKYVNPGSDFRYYTEKKNTFLTSCYEGNATRGIDMMVRPSGSTGSAGWYVPNGSPGDYRIYFYSNTGSNEFGFQFKDSLGAWVPQTDGRGLICWHTATYTDKKSNTSSTGYASIYVYNGANCNTAVKTFITDTGNPNTEAKANAPVAGLFEPAGGRARLLAEPLAGPAATPNAAADNSAIIDVLSSVAVACPWYAYPGDNAKCTGLNVGDDGKWTIDNVSSDIRNFGVTGSIGTNDPKQSVATGSVSIPASSGKGTVSVSKAVATAETSTTATQHGGEVGIKLGFKQTAKAKLPFFGEGGVEFSQEINSEYSYTKTTTESTTKTETRTVSISAEALPGFTTVLDVFTSKRSANYTYKADLDLGKDATVQAVSTPANIALNQSPSFRQPCLEYAIGSQGTRNSLMFTGQQLLNAGNSPTEPTLAPERRAFLASIPYFRTFGAPCPGFPSGYTSQAGFKGDGLGTYENLGYDENGQPVKVMTGCVYQPPFPPTSLSANSKLQSSSVRPTDNNTPCQVVPVAGGKVQGETPGRLINERVTPAGKSVDAGRPVIAPPGSDEILGSNAGGTYYTNNGALDIVYAGRGPTTEIGGTGENLLHGGAGKDTLVGGRLGMNYLEAGSGPTVMREKDGIAVMYGGKGSDTFDGDNMDGVMVGGSGSSRMVGTGNLSRLQMEGGSGANTYVLSGNGTPNIVQPPEAASSTVITPQSLTVPLYVKTAVATGSRAVRLTGSEGTQALVANDGADTLVSGVGAETLRGGRGRDTIVFNPNNDDVAIGGSGADRYEFAGLPETTPRPAALAYPANRTAATITNFNARKGDRLVLTTAVFGSGLKQLRRRFKLIVARDPRPRGRGATLLFSTSTHALSFDPGGNGPISDKVIARLPHQRTIRRGWLQIV
jgi:Clostridium epsilon toxin ETX/Bacillus mosquitocidal toxin MTX2/RTX calcium-binding nonapeptide repeat (4 copies)